MSPPIRPAPLRARALAAAVDGALACAVSEKRSSNLFEEADRADGTSRGLRRARRNAHVELAARLVLRNVASPGQRVAGIRRVDAHTGGAVSLRSAAAREATQLGWYRAIGRLTRPLMDQVERHGTAHRAELARVAAAHPGDRAARDAELERLPQPPAAVAWFVMTVATSVVISPSNSLLTRGGRTLADRLSDTVLVADR